LSTLIGFSFPNYLFVFGLGFLFWGGAIQLVERLADIIQYKGYRVSASEIEAVLQDHPTVVGACVVGVPDPKVGERIKGIVLESADA
jgi:long-chain acyl-CoA synthetase